MFGGGNGESVSDVMGTVIELSLASHKVVISEEGIGVFFWEGKWKGAVPWETMTWHCPPAVPCSPRRQQETLKGKSTSHLEDAGRWKPRERAARKRRQRRPQPSSTCGASTSLPQMAGNACALSG